MKKKVTVFGSFVVDLMSRTPHLPVPGETVKGSMFKMGPGGKGFNQGVAAHKAGADMTMITKLGRDAFANVALDAMKELNMDTSHIFYSDAVETGTALILVDENTSQNEIVVVLGACDTIDEADIASVEDVIKNSQYLLTQLETNVSATERVIDIAHQNGVKVILNTAPVQPVGDEVLAKVYLITPNEVEAEILTGICVDSEENAKKAADWFFAKGVQNVIITLGSRGVYVATAEKQAIMPAYRVDAVDTTGAGDAFNGGLVAALAEGKDIWEACRFANALAAIAVQRLGTTPAMPTRKEIDEFLAVHEKNVG
ncbi:ribokinase [Hydrogenoanaerobacterium sp.]|uniref:ribokinase n=1 Tax=Hydrogenoanaerobacterium sp. TaxID=2953763 RepID=UPI00289B0EAE|nr:ribokinase [Hydrogenoanaerobacterium sp.]